MIEEENLNYEEKLIKKILKNKNNNDERIDVTYQVKKRENKIIVSACISTCKRVYRKKEEEKSFQQSLFLKWLSVFIEDYYCYYYTLL